MTPTTGSTGRPRPLGRRPAPQYEKPGPYHDYVGEMIAHESPEERATAATVYQLAGAIESVPHIWGVGVTTNDKGHFIVVVRTDKLTPEVQSRVPPTMNGFPVKIRVTKGRPHVGLDMH